MPGFTAHGEVTHAEQHAEQQAGALSRYETEIEGDAAAAVLWLVELYPKQVAQE